MHTELRRGNLCASGNLEERRGTRLTNTFSNMPLYLWQLLPGQQQVIQYIYNMTVGTEP